jgi:hypothetical protein
MKNNWKKTIDQINAERFTVPPGWDTKDKVAADLECAPDRVSDILKPGIASGEIERKEFSVWNPGRRMTEKVVCYRVIQEQQPVKVKPERILAAIKANLGKTDGAIAKNLSGVLAADVAKVRSAMKL